jgi:hypothetical protein
MSKETEVLDQSGNVSNIGGGGLTAHEIAEREAALVAAERERAATLAIEAEQRAAYNRQGGGR